MAEYVERGKITELALAALNDYKISEEGWIYEASTDLANDLSGLEEEVSARIEEITSIPPADVVPVEWVPVKERLPEPCFPVWAACKAADGRENWVIETSYIPNPQSKSQWGPVPILETGRATVYAWAERHPPEAPKEG